MIIFQFESFIHSFNKNTLSTTYVQALLGDGDILLIKLITVSILVELVFRVGMGKTDNKHNN